MVREGPPQPAPYPAEKMREDERKLRSPLRPAIIVGAMVAVAVVALVLAFWG